MNNFLKNSLSVLWRVAFANFICIFAMLMVTTILTALFTKEIGYIAYGVKEGSNKTEHLYTYDYADGEDTQKASFEEQGYTVSLSKNHSKLSGFKLFVVHTINQIISIAIVAMFIYPLIWELGFKDSNKVHFNRIKEDKLKGFKLGFASIIPFCVIYLVFAVFALGVYRGFPIIIYKLINCSVFSLLTAIFGDVLTAGEVGILRLIISLLPFLIIPAISGAAYLLGYKGISIGEKLIYKNKKESEK